MLNMLGLKLLVFITLFINVYSQGASQPIVQLDDLKIEAERHSRVASTQNNRASVQVEGKITALPQAAPPLNVDTQVEPDPVVTSTNPPVISWYGGSTVTIDGEHLGVSKHIGVEITIDGQKCEQSIWVSRKRVICKGIPKVPIHMKAAVVVIVGGDAD